MATKLRFRKVQHHMQAADGGKASKSLRLFGKSTRKCFYADSPSILQEATKGLQAQQECVGEHRKIRSLSAKRAATPCHYFIRYFNYYFYCTPRKNPKTPTPNPNLGIPFLPTSQPAALQNHSTAVEQWSIEGIAPLLWRHVFRHMCVLSGTITLLGYESTISLCSS